MIKIGLLLMLLSFSLLSAKGVYNSVITHLDSVQTLKGLDVLED